MKKRSKELCVTIILTESTASLLNLSIPHLEHLDPENSRVFLISPNNYRELADSIETIKDLIIEDNKPSTSQKINSDILYKYEALIAKKGSGKHIEDLYLKISSDVALFSKSSCSSNSCMYEGCDSDDSIKIFKEAGKQITVENISSLENMFEAIKIRKLPLVSVRSVAHGNKLNTNSKDILVALLDSNTNSTDHICRICHGGESLDDLLMPCRCRGTVALVHLKCLERWLKDSQHSHCELCLHHYKTERKPRYSILGSIFAYIREPGPHVRDILLDLLAFTLYTPTAVMSTYILMILCESLVKSNVIQSGTLSSHILAFSAVFGMAAIDFTYSSWLVYTCQRHSDSWREWYNSNSTLKVILPAIKLRPIRKKRNSTKERKT